MKIGLYGGSFNPVHLGHVGIAKRAIADLALDRLVVLPANVSPFKVADAEVRQPETSEVRQPETSEVRQPEIWERVELVKAAFRDLEKTVVDLREVERGGVSYAIDTVRQIAAENPGAELFFVIGEDSVEGLPRWKDIEELKKLCTFKSYPRTPESSTAIRKLFEDNSVVLNQDEKIVRVVRDGLIRKGGYCPCRLPKNPEFFCPCDEFKGQLADKEFHGLCHCRLYRKP